MLDTDFDKVPDDELVFEIWPLILETSPKTSEGDIEYDKLPESIAKFVRVMTLDLEISNGGFNQFFFNSFGNGLSEAEDAVAQILGEPHIDIYRLALQKFLPQASLHENIRRTATDMDDLLSKFSQSYKTMDFGDLDDAWYDNEQNTQEKLIKFIRENRSLILEQLN